MVDRVPPGICNAQQLPFAEGPDYGLVETILVQVVSHMLVDTRDYIGAGNFTYVSRDYIAVGCVGSVN